VNFDRDNIIVLEWMDAQSDTGWQTETKAHVSPCTSVGYIVDENKEAICLASTISGEDSNARMHIPKKWIKSRKTVCIGDNNEAQTNINATVIGSLPGISNYTISDGTNTWKWDANASSFVALQDGEGKKDIL